MPRFIFKYKEAASILFPHRKDEFSENLNMTFDPPPPPPILGKYSAFLEKLHTSTCEKICNKTEKPRIRIPQMDPNRGPWAQREAFVPKSVSEFLNSGSGFEMEIKHQMTMIFWHVYRPGVGVLYLDILKMHLIVTFEYNMILLLSDNIAILAMHCVLRDARITRRSAYCKKEWVSIFK